MAWKLAQSEYEKTSKKAIDEEMLITVLLTRTPKTIKKHLQLQCTNFDCYQDFIDCIESYYSTKRVLGVAKDNSPGGLASMDISAVVAQVRTKRWHNKGKGKDYKGKPKGKGKTNIGTI